MTTASSPPADDGDMGQRSFRPPLRPGADTGRGPTLPTNSVLTESSFRPPLPLGEGGVRVPGTPTLGSFLFRYPAPVPTPISIRNLSKSFGPTTAVDKISLDIAPGELFFLLGPSGCGKTTLLRMIAGFIDPTAGAIFFGAP